MNNQKDSRKKDVLDTSPNIYSQAAKKLEKLEKGQKQAEKYFVARENQENRLKAIESNLKKKLLDEKRAASGLHDKVVTKMEDLLRSLSSVDTNLLTKMNMVRSSEKSDKEIQTETEETEILKEKISNLEKENEKLVVKKQQLKKEKEVIISENAHLKEYNEKLVRENKLLQNNYNEILSQKNEIDTKCQELAKKEFEVSKLCKKYEHDISEYHKLKTVMEEKIKLEQERYEIEEKMRDKDIEKYRGKLTVLVPIFSLHTLTSFLGPKDIVNLQLTNKMMYRGFNKDILCLTEYYKSVITVQNKIIQELKTHDLKKDYSISDNDIEKLMKE